MSLVDVLVLCLVAVAVAWSTGYFVALRQRRYVVSGLLICEVVLNTALQVLPLGWSTLGHVGTSILIVILFCLGWLARPWVNYGLYKRSVTRERRVEEENGYQNPDNFGVW